jgi:hypothetical protein
VCIFVRDDQNFNKIDTLLHYAGQTLEVCASELEIKSSTSGILALCRAPSANKVKVKLSLCLTKHHTMKTYWGNGGIAPHILDLGPAWR